MLPECKFENCCKHCRFYRLCFSEELEHRVGNAAVQLLFSLVLQFLELLQVVFSSGLFFCFLFYYHCNRGTFFKDNMLLTRAWSLILLLLVWDFLGHISALFCTLYYLSAIPIIISMRFMSWWHNWVDDITVQCERMSCCIISLPVVPLVYGVWHAVKSVRLNLFCVLLLRQFFFLYSCSPNLDKVKTCFMGWRSTSYMLFSTFFFYYAKNCVSSMHFGNINSPSILERMA
jgi:hypothetical protein